MTSTYGRLRGYRGLIRIARARAHARTREKLERAQNNPAIPANPATHALISGAS